MDFTYVHEDDIDNFVHCAQLTCKFNLLFISHLVFVNLYDLCKTCVESNTANEHEHEDFEVILADKEDEDCDEEKK
jgi:hypothetical protein